MLAFRSASFGARVSAFVKGVRVKTLHLGYKKTVKTISNNTPRQYTFDCAEFGGKISVELYFKKSESISMNSLSCV
jgi:eukaryotic translation initiation factor 2C